MEVHICNSLIVHLSPLEVTREGRDTHLPSTLTAVCIPSVSTVPRTLRPRVFAAYMNVSPSQGHLQPEGDGLQVSLLGKREEISLC